MTGLQIMSMLLAFTVLTVSLLRIKHKSRERYATFAISFLGLHAVIFYTLVLLKEIGFDPLIQYEHPFTTWSAILRAHTYLTIALMEIYGYWRDKLWTNKTSH